VNAAQLSENFEIAGDSVRDAVEEGDVKNWWKLQISEKQAHNRRWGDVMSAVGFGFWWEPPKAKWRL